MSSGSPGITADLVLRDNLTDPAKKAAATFAGVGESFKRTLGGISEKTALVATGLGVAFGYVTGHIAKGFLDTDRAAKLYGMTVEEMERTTVAARRSTNELGSSIMRLSFFIGNARDGSKTARQTLKDLGLTMEQMEQGSTYEVFQAIVKGLHDISDASQRSKMAMQIFGRFGMSSMEEFLAYGPDVFERAEKRMKQLGIGKSQEDVNTIKRSKESVDELTMSLDELGEKITVAVAPSVKKLADGLSALLGRVNDGSVGLFKWVGGFLALGTGAAAVGYGLNVVLNGLKRLLDIGASVLTLLKKLQNAQAISLALSGPKGWAILAGSAIVAGAAIYGLSEAWKKADKAAQDYSSSATEAGKTPTPQTSKGSGSEDIEKRKKALEQESAKADELAQKIADLSKELDEMVNPGDMAYAFDVMDKWLAGRDTDKPTEEEQKKINALRAQLAALVQQHTVAQDRISQIQSEIAAEEKNLNVKKQMLQIDEARRDVQAMQTKQAIDMAQKLDDLQKQVRPAGQLYQESMGQFSPEQLQSRWEKFRDAKAKLEGGQKGGQTVGGIKEELDTQKRLADLSQHLEQARAERLARQQRQVGGQPMGEAESGDLRYSDQQLREMEDEFKKLRDKWVKIQEEKPKASMFDDAEKRLQKMEEGPQKDALKAEIERVKQLDQQYQEAAGGLGRLQELQRNPQAREVYERERQKEFFDIDTTPLEKTQDAMRKFDEATRSGVGADRLAQKLKDIQSAAGATGGITGVRTFNQDIDQMRRQLEAARVPAEELEEILRRFAEQQMGPLLTEGLDEQLRRKMQEIDAQAQQGFGRFDMATAEGAAAAEAERQARRAEAQRQLGGVQRTPQEEVEEAARRGQFLRGQGRGAQADKLEFDARESLISSIKEEENRRQGLTGAGSDYLSNAEKLQRSLTAIQARSARGEFGQGGGQDVQRKAAIEMGKAFEQFGPMPQFQSHFEGLQDTWKRIQQSRASSREDTPEGKALALAQQNARVMERMGINVQDFYRWYREYLQGQDRTGRPAVAG